ncbi:MAG: endolytic transglycosylase MltG [Lachnospiraceae bacterium]|nr:endolytic transglycosylase MltG [Lachnospiraceae bacterium]
MNTKQMVMAVLGMIFKVAVTIIVVFFVYKAALVAYDYGYRIFQETPVSAAPGIDVEVDITVGKSPLQIGEILEQKGLIRDAKLFYIQNLLSKYKDKLQAGTYVLNTSMTMEEMMAVMSVESSESETTEPTSDESTEEIMDDSGDEIPEETENNDDNG